MRRKIAIWSAAYALLLAVGAWSIPASVDAAAYTKCKADETLVEWAHDDDRQRAGGHGGYDCVRKSDGQAVFWERYQSKDWPTHVVAQRAAPRLVDDTNSFDKLGHQTVHRVLVHGQGDCGGWETADGGALALQSFVIFVYRPC